MSTTSGAAADWLDWLEAESIFILREVAAVFQNPVMLYSLGKDSSVLLHLLRKAFAPTRPPIPLLHIDTGWKFQAMYAFRERVMQAEDITLKVYKNPEGDAQGLSPVTHGSKHFTDVMKTQALVQALTQGQFDAAIGGARRDEESSRAKERIFSFRNSAHAWDPRQQRPELWRLFNTRIQRGESVRVFPLSNWTELDIWRYIQREAIPIVPLYFAAVRQVLARAGTLIMRDDDRLTLQPNEALLQRKVRFRTLGCYPLSGAIVAEMQQSQVSERQGRLIDQDSVGAMERKKREGYF
jgi:sulfate adenylyltransferase subunit 2